MVKPSSSKNGGVYHFNFISHGNDEHSMMDRFRNPSKKLGDFFYAMMSDSGCSFG